ncbi:hypothetical protein K402DRAFT_424070 [Aulographum hederae CBS 113979]|uniref:Uncharacterized protein n=1 Tax=Aulographum hederae CBS 113979 TaxID=1176131 RepID=A0A6G1GQ08_9PEZI|nr:hypothetical protein K402DRAFT_424070 [Aulographum hederae CBS 113979]
MSAVDAQRPPDRHRRGWPFNSIKRRLASLKAASPKTSEKKNHQAVSPTKPKKADCNGKNNPYPESGHLHRPPAPASTNGRSSFSVPPSDRVGSYASYEDDASARSRAILSNKSAAPTLATNPETVHSDAGQSKAGTSNTVGGGMSSRDGGADSTFSSPNHSDRSLTTTLTTIQSAAPSGMLATAPAPPTNVQFAHQYPISPPASAVPTHLQPHPHTYSAATANNILTDDASILTLASSSKRRRRHSLDTDASVRALAPSSLFGNSRESLPLSVLSSNMEGGGIYQSQNRPSVGGIASAERASVYSSSGITAPLLSSERNSYYASKSAMDGGSVRSGLLGHGRTESISGSIASPLTSPKDSANPGGARMSRRSSEWKEEEEQEQDQDAETETETEKEEPSDKEPENEKEQHQQNGRMSVDEDGAKSA